MAVDGDAAVASHFAQLKLADFFFLCHFRLPRILPCLGGRSQGTMDLFAKSIETCLVLRSSARLLVHNRFHPALSPRRRELLQSLLLWHSVGFSTISR